jgi:hypothetical protein
MPAAVDNASGVRTHRLVIVWGFCGACARSSLEYVRIDWPDGSRISIVIGPLGAVFK